MVRGRGSRQARADGVDLDPIRRQGVNQVRCSRVGVEFPADHALARKDWRPPPAVCRVMIDQRLRSLMQLNDDLESGVGRG